MRSINKNSFFESRSIKQENFVCQMSLEAKWEILSGKLREGFWEKTSGMKDLSGDKLPITYGCLCNCCQDPPLALVWPVLQSLDYFTRHNDFLLSWLVVWIILPSIWRVSFNSCSKYLHIFRGVFPDWIIGKITALIEMIHGNPDVRLIFTFKRKKSIIMKYSGE